MSKLDGNVRWNSKMLMTEHQEHYDGKPAASPAMRPTPEELTMIRDYVLLPHIMTMVQKSMDDIEHSGNILKRLYLTASQVVFQAISKDLYDLKRELKRRNIKIWDDEQVDMVVYYKFVCRGYEDRFRMPREVMRAQISVRLTKYIGDLSGTIKETGKNRNTPASG